MARRKKSNKNFEIGKMIFFGILGLSLIGLTCYGIVFQLKESELFRVKGINYEPSVTFIKSYHLSKLKGKSIFEVDLAATQKAVQRQYPQVSQLKVIRRFPDKIYVEAKRRNAFAQILISSRNLLIDEEGVVLSNGSISNGSLPLIYGIDRSAEAEIGYPIKDAKVQMALNIIKDYNAKRILASHPILKMDVGNLSKIDLYMQSGLNVKLDRDRIQHKLTILQLLFEQKKINSEEFKYVDLRFKEPVLRRK